MRFETLLVSLFWAVIFGNANSKNGAHKRCIVQIVCTAPGRVMFAELASKLPISDFPKTDLEKPRRSRSAETRLAGCTNIAQETRN